MISTYLESGKFAGFFTDEENIPEGYFIAQVEYPNNLIDGYYNKINNLWYENASLEQISQLTIDAETKKYIQRSNDGLNAYARLSAEFRIAKQLGQITEESHAVIEKLLIPVRNEILAGQWISGLNELVSIGPEQIGQDLYDRLFNQISAYIELNYSSIEQQASKVQISKSK